MNKVIDTYLNSIWLPGVVMITSLVIAAVTSMSNIFIFKMLSIVSSISWTASVPALVVVGVYQIKHNKKISGIIHAVVGVLLIFLFMLLGLGE